MTPAVNLVKKHQLPYQLHEYQHDPSAQSYGLEAAEKLQVDPALVFKTLVVSTDSKQLVVAILPVEHQLNLKKVAKAIKAKKVQMADSALVERTTGYILGGVSPLGQKKRLTTVIHQSAEALAQIYFSAGKRGLELQMSPIDLQSLLTAKFVDIIND
ncbi:Cys-tRNA(Pro) deacylase [Shewanella gaetbuli]|uniref:Cys-tRNA(Pro)/Cys-tRNA(Cys) deacylase n=1 Tax=Shewanella gaetbuli TaxID=220752 RepID=A0A9X2CGR3_9GAMM|nr:Cys-tRNA(Pro) deacylase [Shewanella gaetbuli]MCL1141212.1 Cys-tRNA(Pro) deacylase [Shewanella gaetbuli]